MTSVTSPAGVDSGDEDSSLLSALAVAGAEDVVVDGTAVGRDVSHPMSNANAIKPANEQTRFMMIGLQR